jgi:hypothetical protein
VDEGRRKGDERGRRIASSTKGCARTAPTARDFLCECAAWRCNELMRLTRAKDKTVRSNSRRFATVSGHDIPDVEDVVEHHEHYAVIESTPMSTTSSKATDPRRPLED